MLFLRKNEQASQFDNSLQFLVVSGNLLKSINQSPIDIVITFQTRVFKFNI